MSDRLSRALAGVAVTIAVTVLTPCAFANPLVPAPAEAEPVYRPRQGPRAADQPVETLREAIRLVYDDNPDLAAQRATLRATDNRYPGARAASGLTLDAQLRHGYQYNRREVLAGTFSSLSGFSTTATAILNQPLYTFGRNASAEKVALAQIAFGRDSLRLTESGVLLSAVTAYVSVQRDRMGVRNAEQNLALLERQLRDNRERFRVREITIADFNQIETRVGLARAQLLAAQGQMGVSESQFIQVIGAPAGSLDDPQPLDVPVTSLEQATAIADRTSAILRAAQSREKVSRAAVAVARAEMGPRVDLQGRADHGAASPYSNDLQDTTMRGEVVLSVPLIDSGSRRARVREAIEANAADWRLIEQALRDTRQGVAASWNRLAAARLSIAHYRDAVTAARKAYEGAVLQEKAGMRTTLDVLDLARDLLFMENSLNGAIADEYLARANLLAAMGLLEAPKLLPDLKAYDPDDHFDRVKGKGGVPLLSPAVSGVDSLTTPSISPDRPITDPAATVLPPDTVLRAGPPSVDP